MVVFHPSAFHFDHLPLKREGRPRGGALEGVRIIHVVSLGLGSTPIKGKLMRHVKNTWKWQCKTWLDECELLFVASACTNLTSMEFIPCFTSRQK
ncbi:hypothetical protein VNO80_23505 [Phaseolus coccineus]|uniref:Uncharacterized protein n=1 Tax=Phaseolus coccineus TaxID=3886 RepID=A0AAN9M5U0_PHACN